MEERRTFTIAVRLTEKEFKALKKKAEENAIPMSSYARYLLFKKLN